MIALPGHPLNSKGIDTRLDNTNRFSPDGNAVALSLKNGDIRLVDLRTGEESLLREHAAAIKTSAFSPDGTMLASGDFDGAVMLWNVATRQQILEFSARADQKAHQDSVPDVAFSPDGQTLATASRDDTAKLWDVTTGTLLHTFEMVKYTDSPSSVWSVAFSPDGKKLATGTSGDRMVFLWDVASRELLHRLSGHDNYVNRLVFSEDGTVLASAGGSKIMLWDVEGGNRLDSFPITWPFTFFLSFSPDASVLAAADEGGVKLWQLSDPANPRVRAFPYDWKKGMASVSLDGSTVVMGSETSEGRIEVWDMTTGAVINTFPHGATVTRLSWNRAATSVVPMPAHSGLDCGARRITKLARSTACLRSTSSSLPGSWGGSTVACGTDACASDSPLAARTAAR